MSQEVFVHPSAIVDPGCQVGGGTKIWHFCHLMPKAVIGKDCVLGQNVFVADDVKIGQGVKIQNNVSVYTGVTLEDEVFCGPSVVFSNVLTPRSFISRNNPENRKPTLVKKGATLGANATVICGVTIGQYAFVGAGAVVAQDVADFALVVGNPAKQVGWRCVCSLKLTLKNDSTACLSCGREYQLTEKSLKLNS
jgi:UDP-2-acetamido-3-amino-2,3-dideoxy-glucuronate N-acetyltransferase